MVKGYRAALIDPKPEDYLLSTTCSSWRRRRSSAEEAAQAFRLATQERDLRITIEEANVELCDVAWMNQKTEVTGEETMLLPIHGDRFADALVGLYEKYGQLEFAIRSLSIKNITACQLRRMRKYLR